MYPLAAQITDIADRLAQIDGVVAVALGGSRARGAARPDSDVDLGIYYDPDRRPSVAALNQLAQELDDRHPTDAISTFGEWGPWINGGGWLVIDGVHVDWLFRDLRRVAWAIAECRAGRPTSDYQIGHPHGFHSHIYMGEVHHARALRDFSGALAQLQALTSEYPPLLKRVLIQKFLFEAEFSLVISRKAPQRGDVAYLAGCLFRCVAALVQVLYALNERYCLNEKGAVAAIDMFPLRPEGFGRQVATVLGELGTDAAECGASIDRMAELVRAVRALCADLAPSADWKLP